MSNPSCFLHLICLSPQYKDIKTGYGLSFETLEQLARLFRPCHYFHMKAVPFIDSCSFKHAIIADTDNLGLCHQETSPLELLFIIGKRGVLIDCQFF